MEDYWDEECVDKEDFYDLDEIDREIEDGLMSPEEGAFSRGFVESL